MMNLGQNYWQGADKTVNLYWGIAVDGSVMISDNVDLIKASCGKSFAPFPAGMSICFVVLHMVTTIIGILRGSTF